MNKNPFFKKNIIIMLFILAFFNARSQETLTSSFEIHFQDFFVNDKICLSINQYTILINKVITSDLVTGVTDVIVKFYFYKGSGLVKIGQNSFKIPQTSMPIKLKVSLNGKLSEFKINLEQGKFIGLSKKERNKFYFHQSKNGFEYY